jgi:hypothetical protein
MYELDEEQFNEMFMPKLKDCKNPDDEHEEQNSSWWVEE